MKKLIAISLSIALAGLSAGVEPYAACAGVVAQTGASAPAAPGGAVGAAGSAVNPAGTPGMTSVQVDISLQPSLQAGALPTLSTGKSAPAATITPEAAISGHTPAAPVETGRAPRAVAVSAAPTGPVSIPAATPLKPVTKAAVPAAGPQTAGRRAAPSAKSISAAATLTGTVSSKSSSPDGTRVSAPKLGASTLRRIYDGANAAAGKASDPAVTAGRSIQVRSSGLGRNSITESQGRSNELPPPPGRDDAAGAEAALEGTLDVSSYRVPLSIRARRAAALGAHYALLAGSLALLVFAAGPIPVALASAALGAKAAWRFVSRAEGGVINGASAFNEAQLARFRDLAAGRTGAQAESEIRAFDEISPAVQDFLDRNERTAETLVRRLGLDPYRAPRVMMDATPGSVYSAGSPGRSLDKSSIVFMGLGFMLRPFTQGASVMAHEFGHLFFGDRGPLRDLFRSYSAEGGPFTRGMLAIGLLAAISAGIAQAGALIFSAPLSLPVFAAAIGGAVVLAAAGILAGLAATRQEELRADHFAAWLTSPEWLTGFFRDQRARGAESHGRARTTLLSTHPSLSRRIDALERMTGTPRRAERDVLPRSESMSSLNGTTELSIRGADGAAEGLAERLAEDYDVETFESGGLLRVRVHPKKAAHLSTELDQAAVDAVMAAVRKAAPGAALEEAASRPHDVFSWAEKSPTARPLLRVLRSRPIAVRWEMELAGTPTRGALRLRDDEDPEIIVNPLVFWNASPKALISLLAHEVFHYQVYLELRRMGIDWLSLGGMEFERLAHSVGARVWKELDAGAADDIEAEFHGGSYESVFRRFATMEREAHVDFLRDHGYARFMRLSELRATDAASIAAMIGEESPEEIRGKLDALWSLYNRRSLNEALWRARHPLHTIRAKVRESRRVSGAEDYPEDFPVE